MGQHSAGAKMIYFDNAATAPVFTSGVSFYGNASSPHALGIEAERMIHASRLFFAEILQCHPGEIIFTSGGTESNNLAIFGFLKTLSRKGGFVLAAPSEHPSVLEPIKNITAAVNLKPQIIPVQEWEVYLGKDCVFASISHVNHETGDINDIAAAAEMIKGRNPETIIHVDGVQGFCKEDILLKNIDLYSWSAHKCHGPAGIGGLMKRKDLRLTPLLYGGGQQGGIRPGTENTAGICGMGSAIELLWKNKDNHRRHVSIIKDILMDICNFLDDVCVNALGKNTSPYILNMSFLGIKGETLVNMLSEQGIYVSMGAACHSRKNRISALASMGFSEERAASAVRFSFSHMNTPEESETVKDALYTCVKRLRKLKKR